MAKKVNNPLPPRGEEIIQRSMEDVMHDSMIPYSEYVILERALPRVEDGLKPVQRRILFTMHELGISPDKPHRKCARIVGDCLGKYHPHGDTSVYDALTRMAQPFVMREMLVDGHGNFGSIDGDTPAAMRYTEARMTELTTELLRDIEKDTVSFHLNFDDTQKEPDVLPGRFPNLLVNGASGIAVGLATNIPPHNLREAVAAVIAQIDDPAITTQGLMAHIPAPDFSTGGILLKDEELTLAYETGRGKLLLRARVEIEDGPSGRKLLVITEMPYQVSKAALLEKILRLSEEKKAQLSGIHDIRDESDRTGMRAVVELKRDVDPEKVLNYLYKYSDLQVTFGVNIVAIAGGKPVQLGLKQMIAHFISHQKDVVSRRTRFELEQAKARAHILEGLIIAVDNLDEVIRLIRASKNPKEARERLMEAFALSELQAQAILDMRLQRLTNLEIISLREEYAQIKKLIDRLEGILGSERKLMGVIKAELQAIAEKHGDARRTEISEALSREIVIEQEAAVADEALLIFTENGFVKRMPPRTYERGVAAEPEEAAPALLVPAMTDQKVLLFTNLGNGYLVSVAQVPECRFKERGLPLGGLLPDLAKNEMPAYAHAMAEGDWAGDFLFVTEGGLIKRTARAEYDIRKTRSQAIKLKDGDRLLKVIDDELSSLILFSERGMVIHFPLDQVPAMGRVSAGVKGMTLVSGDKVAHAVPGGEEGEVLLVTDYGFAKRCLMVDFDMQARGGKGVKAITFNKNGSNGSAIAAALPVTEPYDFLIRQKSGAVTNLNTDTVRIELKAGKGASYVLVAMDDVVVSATRVDKTPIGEAT